MPFTFPDPTVTPEFTAANGITYSWDGEDEKWVVKAYKTGDGGTPGKESQPYIDFSQFAVLSRSSRYDYDPIFSTNPIAEYTWEYQINLDTVADATAWVKIDTLDPAILTSIGWYGSMSQTHLRLNKMDPAAETLYPNAQMRFRVESTLNGITNEEITCPLYAWDAGECPYTLEVNQLEERVARGEDTQEVIQETISEALNTQQSIQTEQAVQNSQINALETQLQLLAQSKAVGRWTYRRRIEGASIRPPATATFYGTDKNDPTGAVLTSWQNLQLLMIDKTDKDGTVFTFSDFEEGDKLEILATDGSSGCFGTVTNNPNIESYGNMLIAVERSNGGPVEETEYLLNVYRPGVNAGDVDMDVLDNRYLIKAGDEMDSGAYLTFNDAGQKFQNAAGEKQGYIYTASPKLIQITTYNGNQFKITCRDGDPGGGRTYLDAKTANSSGTGGEDSGYRLRLYHLADPTEELHAANKRYVDSKTSSGAKLIRWTCLSGSGSDGLEAGQFRQRSSGASDSTNKTWQIWIAYKAKDLEGNERRWFPENSNALNTSSGIEYFENLSGQIVSINDATTGAIWGTGVIKDNHPIFNKSSINYCYIECHHFKSYEISMSYSTNRYYITLSPYLPQFYI